MKIKIIRPEQRYRKPRAAGQHVTDVDLGNFEYGEGIFSTFGASTGLVLAAHNSESRMGLLGHFNSFVGGKDGLSDAVVYETALCTLPDLGPLNKTDVWLGGVAPSRIGDLDVAMENRQFAIDRLDAYRERLIITEAPVTISWNPEGTYISARLACDVGRLLVRQAFDLP